MRTADKRFRNQQVARAFHLTRQRRALERAAVIVTTNRPFSEWTTMSPNARLCKATIDQLTDQAHIIPTGTESDVPANAGPAETGESTVEQQGRAKSAAEVEGFATRRRCGSPGLRFALRRKLRGAGLRSGRGHRAGGTTPLVVSEGGQIKASKWARSS